MIEKFKENEVRETGVINKGMWEQVKMLYQQGNVEVAGELAISLMEIVLTGDYSSDDFLVEFAMKNHGIVVEKTRNNYDKKIKANRAKQIDKLELVKIAELIAKGYTQASIAKALKESAATISYRVGVLREDYPELLEEASQKNQKNQKNQKDYNDNDNDNEDEDEDDNEFLACAKNKSHLPVGGPQPEGQKIWTAHRKNRKNLNVNVNVNGNGNVKSFPVDTGNNAADAGGAVILNF